MGVGSVSGAREEGENGGGERRERRPRYGKGERRDMWSGRDVICGGK